MTGKEKINPFLSGVQIFMIWFIWFANQYIILVIMLNFLISVISDTYVRVTERNKMHTYRYRNQLNIEYLSIRDKFRTPMKVNCMLMVTNNDEYQLEEDNFSEIKDQIIEVVEETHKETKESIN
jgi:hypothetical protein